MMNGVSETCSTEKITEAYVSFDTTKISNSEEARFLKSAVQDKSEI